MAEVFEHIMEQCPKKKVVSLCKKLSKKCSFGSSADCENLCHLTYWLYIFERPDLAMQCIALTHDVPFKTDYTVWTFLHAMWGLEMRLLRAQDKEDAAQQIAATIDAHLLTPGKADTPERMPQREERRRLRFTYEDAIKQEKIEPHLQAGNKTRANDWRFTALLGMIGNTETGLYPLLNERRDDLEAKIAEYIAELRK